jgi:hypothetical protein
MGVTALVAAGVAAGQPTPDRWLAVWLVCAVFAVGMAGWGMVRKARRADMPLLEGPARKFALSFLPPVIAAMLVTAALHAAGATTLLPGVWLLLYGVAVVTAGTYSVGIVPVMGVCFMVLGAIAFVAPAAWADVFMATGFGALHIGFGAVIARRHGG